MLGDRKKRDEKIEVTCPKCKATVTVTAEEAEKGKVKCPRGHEVEVVGLLGG